MKTLLLGILLCLTMVHLQAQKWWKPTRRELFGYTALTLSGISYGFNQAIEHHNYGYGNSFVDINVSYKNKYRNYDAGDMREAYFGSKTFLAFTTDAFHLTNTLDKGFLTTGVILTTWDFKSDLKKYPKKDRWKVIAFKKILIPLVLQHLSFEIMFSKLPYGGR